MPIEGQQLEAFLRQTFEIHLQGLAGKDGFRFPLFDECANFSDGIWDDRHRSWVKAFLTKVFAQLRLPMSTVGSERNSYFYKELQLKLQLSEEELSSLLWVAAEVPRLMADQETDVLSKAYPVPRPILFTSVSERNSGKQLAIILLDPKKIQVFSRKNDSNDLSGEPFILFPYARTEKKEDAKVFFLEVDQNLSGFRMYDFRSSGEWRYVTYKVGEMDVNFVDCTSQMNPAINGQREVWMRVKKIPGAKTEVRQKAPSAISAGRMALVGQGI